VLLVALATALHPWGSPVRGGDEEIARLLLQGAKEDVTSRRWDDALTKLEKARVEDPALTEALYWAGVALEGKKDPPAALARYRAFREEGAAKTEADAGTAEVRALAGKAQARIDALAPGEVEHRRLTEAFAARLLAFARGQVERDPVLARTAVDRALESQPDNAEAKEFARRLAAAAAGEPIPAPAAPPVDPFKSVKKWDDLVTGQPLMHHEGWKYGKGVIQIDLRGGVTSFGPPDKFSGSRYVYEAEIRLLHAYETTWTSGLAFGKRGDERHVFFLGRSGPGYLVTKGEGGALVVKELVDAPIQDEVWYRIGIVVDNDVMEGWFEGKKVLERRPTDRPDWGGDIGISCARAKVEFRGVRWAKRN
jgi:hypothetical protein